MYLAKRNNALKSEQKQSSFFEEENYVIRPNYEEDPKELRNPFDFQKEAEEGNFEEIFGTICPPNISSISISTLSSRSIDNFSISEDFFIDDFLSENYFRPLEDNICESPNQLHTQTPMAPISISEQKQLIKDNATQLKEPQEPANCHDQTKNIPKNYIKAIFTFILEHSTFIENLFNSLNLDCGDQAKFIDYIKTQKKTKRYTIQRLKSLWLDQEFGKVMRIISCHFLKKRSLHYIYSSKIEKKIQHVKYLSKFISAIENPLEFTNIK